MKFAEYLQQPDRLPPTSEVTPLTQDEQVQFTVIREWLPPYWDPLNPAIRWVQTAQFTDDSGNVLGDAVPLPYTSYTRCFVFVQQFQTIEVGEEYLDWRYQGDIANRSIRDFTFRRLALSQPTVRDQWFPQDGQGLRLALATNENGRWWGLATAGDRCTTTTTTTQPPCNCTTHPSMQFTISGVTLRPGAGQCGPNDQICSQFNRTWCLPFQGRSWSWSGQQQPCYWQFTLNYSNGCPPGSLWYGGSTISATLRWPLYKIWNPATSSYVCPAELNFGVYRYQSLDFHPDTGGTFTDGNQASPWAPTCIGWPSSLTVAASANCNPDPPTTTTTTSTTSGPPGP